nr:RNA-directed DNA polymerase, eukaryota [Tanacetum cinerariifolium]
MSQKANSKICKNMSKLDNFNNPRVQNGEYMILGDFNEVRLEYERISTNFNALGSNAFNHFITRLGLVDLPLEGYSYTWTHKSASKMSKLDRFLVSEVEETWKSSFPKEVNGIILLKKKFQVLKSAIKQWCKEEKRRSNSSKSSIQSRLIELDKMFDQGKGNVELVNERSSLLKDLLDLNASASLDMAQKAKIRWSIEGDENSKYFYGIIDKKRSQPAIRGILVEGAWIDEYAQVKKEFFNHFANRFSSIVLDSQFPSRLSLDQIDDLERNVSYGEIKRDVVAAVSEFFSSSKFPSGCNASFITLIPKTQDAKLVKDFRPISLIGSIYKIITEIMANRIILVMSDLVNDAQSAFVANRQILDGPFILNELISWCKYKKTKAMIFKVDFEKAFDSVRWDYLDDILDKFGFGLKWRGWIQGCLNSAKGSILVNGSPTNVLDAGLFKRIQIDDSMTLSHLFYADDAVFIGKWDKSNISTLVNVLNCFFLASGLKINLHKSKLMGIGISQNDVTRLSKWKLKTLFIGGRLTLIKSVLSSMPLYQMSMHKVPMCILNRMESIRRDFFNGVENKERKLSMIAWKKVLAAKNKGGLAFPAIFGIQGALDNPHSLTRRSNWLDVIREFGSMSSKGINLLSHAKIKVGNGMNTSFWNDVWLSESPLKQCFPRLFALEDDKLVSVFDKLNDPSLIESFRRTPREGIEDSQLHSLAKNVAGVILSSQNDRWVWSLESSGLFSVKSARVCIDDYFLSYVGVSTRWVNAVPIKINIFAWRMSLDKLPTRLNLSLRGIYIPSIICPICSIAGESSSHIFFKRHVARELLCKVARWRFLHFVVVYLEVPKSGANLCCNNVEDENDIDNYAEIERSSILYVLPIQEVERPSILSEWSQHCTCATSVL